jgi:hypothetical protein
MRIGLSWPCGSDHLKHGQGATSRALAAVWPVEATAHRSVEGESMAIPFGPTPVSVVDECRLVTHVNRVGTLGEIPGARPRSATANGW